MSSFSYGQSASTSWTLTANANCTNVGNVTGDLLAIGSGINIFNYNTARGVATNNWSNDANSLRPTEYYEFKVAPNANTVFNVTAINFEHSVSGGNWLVQAYYSTDGFVTSTPISTAFSSNSATPTSNNNTVNINVDASTLSVRIFGWESDGNNRLRIKDLIISGTTCAKPAVPGTASSFSATCSGFTAQWGFSNTTTAYFIDVATNTSFSPATIVPAYNNFNAGNVLSLVLTGLNPGTTYYYRVRAANGCGTSSNSSTMNYATAPIPTVAPVAGAASGIYCSGAQLNFTTGANVTGVYLDIATDNAFTNFISGYNNYDVGYNSGTIPVSNLPAGTLYYRIRGYNSCGVTANSNTISFSTPSPIGGTVSPAQKICSGTSPANLILTGYSTVNTEILKWQKSSNAAFSSPIDIAVTTPTLSGATIGNLTVDTYFRAVVRNTFGSWCESFSTPVLISISLAPTITPNKVDETCSSSNSGSISPIFSGGLSNVRYIKLTQKYADYQQVAEIQAFEIFTGTNVALSTSGAVATGSSVWIDSVGPNYIPSNVNNGVTTGSTFWHSKTNNLDEWVKIDLQSAKNIDYIKIFNRTDCCSTRGQNMLLELFDASNTLIYSKTVDLYQSGSNFTEINVLDVSWADGTTTLNRTGLSAGTYTLNYTDTVGCSVSSPIIINPFVINTWNGISWSNGTPNNTQSIIFDGDYYSSSDLTGTVLNACSCVVNAGRTVDFDAGHTLNLINGLQVVSGGEIFFKDTSSLVQETNVQNNVGTIKYERKVSNTIRESDYTYWSSPVAGFTLGSVYSPNPNGMFYSYASTAVPEDWKEESSSTVMAPGVGYIINGKTPTFPLPTTDFFEGVPNNGPITVPVVFTNPLSLPPSDPNYGVSYLLGNPYPSAIDASSFLSANSSYLGGTLYFWTHNTEIGIGVTNPGTGAFAYSGDDYASFNGTGGVAASGGAIPTGYIAAGQGFFATSIASGNVIFNNDMRVSANNTQFFKIKKPNSKAVSTIEKNRVWLNLTNTQGVFKQTLVGYVTNATNEFDTNFDGITFDGNEFVDFYSINQNNNLVIQGRSLPFDENDEVPLGFRTTINGDFTIDIDQVDGLLTNQPVFIEDKWTNTTFDLKNGKYTFNTAAGTFNDRFVLKFTSKTLGIDVTDKEDGILAFYSNDYKTLIIKNYMSDTTVNSVTLFNLQGQKIENWDVSNKDQNNIQIPIKNRSSGIYLVKIKTSKGESTKKIIVN